MEQLLTHAGMQGITHVNPDMVRMCQSLAAWKYLKGGYRLNVFFMKTETSSVVGDLSCIALSGSSLTAERNEPPDSHANTKRQKPKWTISHRGQTPPYMIRTQTIPQWAQLLTRTGAGSGCCSALWQVNLYILYPSFQGLGYILLPHWDRCWLIHCHWTKQHPVHNFLHTARLAPILWHSHWCYT